MHMQSLSDKAGLLTESQVEHGGCDYNAWIRVNPTYSCIVLECSLGKGEATGMIQTSCHAIMPHFLSLPITCVVATLL